jgi:hypothetical protein
MHCLKQVTIYGLNVTGAPHIAAPGRQCGPLPAHSAGIHFDALSLLLEEHWRQLQDAAAAVSGPLLRAAAAARHRCGVIKAWSVLVALV